VTSDDDVQLRKLRTRRSGAWRTVPKGDGPLRRAIIEIKGIYSDQLPAAPGAPRFCNSPDGVVVDAASKALKAT